MSERTSAGPIRHPRSFSPASPPYHLAKPVDESKSTAFHPQTPTSPPLASSGSHADVLPPSTQYCAVTPPASTPMSAEPSQQPSSTTSHPVSSADLLSDGDLSSQRAVDHGIGITDDANDSTTQTPAGRTVARDADELQNQEFRRSDHDREEKEPPVTGQRERVWPNENSGPHYKLSEAPYPTMQPQFSQNFFDLYGLNQIANSVARRDPLTGDQKKLRKSYQNYTKDLSGKNKPISNPQEFMELLHYPDDEWRTQEVSNKEMEKGLSLNILSKLDHAVKMESGKLPKDEYEKWRNILDLDDPQAKTGVIQQPLNKNTTAKSVKQSGSSALPLSEPPRPSRRGTKRRYNEDSFEGYGEGFVDDSVEGSGAMEDDDDRLMSGKKKRRRDTGGATSPPFTENIGPYSSGTISVGSGSFIGR